MRYYLASTVFTDNYEFAIKKTTSNIPTYIHMHDYIEIEFIVNGTGKYMVDQTEYNLQKGAMFLVDLGHSHSMLCEGRSEYYDLYFSKDFLEDLFPFSDKDVDVYQTFCAFNYKPMILFDEEMASEIERILVRIYNEYCTKKAGFKTFIRTLLSLLFLEMYRFTQAQRISRSNRHPHIILPRISDYINLHYAEPIKLNDIAKQYNYNPAYFGRLFKKTYGVTFDEYLKNKRMENIVILLTTTTIAIDEIIQKSGYHNKSYFFREFYKKFNCTPKEYRKKYHYTPQEYQQ